MLLDGGVTERPLEAEQSTFILDTKLHSTTSWRWASDIKIGGIDLPTDRRQHQMYCIAETAFVMMGAGMGPVRDQFIRGDVSVTASGRQRRFEIIFTQLKFSVPETLPYYLQGSKANYEPTLNLIYWLSPVPKSEKCMSQSGLGLFRLKLDKDANELRSLGASPALRLGVKDHVPCLLGHAFGPCANGLILYGGAVVSNKSSNVWEGLHRIHEVPNSSNDLYFLQMF